MNTTGRTNTFYLSSKSGHVDIVNVLLSHGADTEVKNWVSKY